jgi:hypothetical protein
MLIVDIFVLLLISIKYSYCKTSIINYPMVNLLENSPLKTFVISINSSLNLTNSRKMVLLNFNGFELKYFSMINENIYTNNLIDREEFIKKKYCLDNLSCEIELHILINDGLEYFIIPIHIIE